MRRLLFALALFGLCLLAVPSTAGAKDLYNGVDCGKASAAAKAAGDDRIPAVCRDKTNDNPLTGSDGLLANITNIVSYAAGAAAVIVIIVSALRFITSGSDISTNSRTDTDVENARKTLANAVIGLAIIVLARSLIMFVLNRT
jgi:hypothetical protein